MEDVDEPQPQRGKFPGKVLVGGLDVDGIGFFDALDVVLGRQPDGGALPADLVGDRPRHLEG